MSKLQYARERLFVILCATFLTTLLVADLSGGKFFALGTLEISAGVIPFPIAFLITDVVNEYYGKRGARFVTAIGMAMLILAFTLLTGMRWLPVSLHSPIPQPAFDAVFGVSGRFFAASLTAYVIAQFTDIHMFHWTKRITKSKHLWLRATGSTAISQVVDTSIVNFVALNGILSFHEITRISVWAYLYKMAVAGALTPIIYVIHKMLERQGIEPLAVHDASLSDMPVTGP